jgi:DNA-binding NarL/FixJ family response regulator
MGLRRSPSIKQQADEIDAVLMDMRMPKMSGAIALAALQQINPNFKAIMTSGVVSMNEVAQPRELNRTCLFT